MFPRRFALETHHPDGLGYVIGLAAPWCMGGVSVREAREPGHFVVSVERPDEAEELFRLARLERDVVAVYEIVSAERVTEAA